jgi:prepilin-type N-terminal cleavage/methylation domain-containing protein
MALMTFQSAAVWPQRPARSAFTLVEMMVVIAIIATLLAITGVAVQKTAEGQRYKTTREQLLKGQQTLDLEYERIVKQCTNPNNTIPQPVVNYCESDVNRSRAVWTAMNLRQQFPDSFAEALSSVYISQDSSGVLHLRIEATPLVPPLPAAPPTMPMGETLIYWLKPVSTFAVVATAVPIPKPMDESGSLLCIIIGSKTVAGGGAMATSSSDLGHPRQVLFGAVPLDTYRDAWDNSVGFRRWYGVNAGEDEVQQPQYYGSTNLSNANNHDPMDPRNLVAGWKLSDGTPNLLKQGEMLALGFNNRNRMATLISMARDVNDPTDDLFGFRIRRDGISGRATPP